MTTMDTVETVEAVEAVEKDKELDRLFEIYEELRETTRIWGLCEDWDEDEARRLREEAVLLNHQRYLRKIPAYRTLAEELDIGDDLTDVETIKIDLMSTDDIFKSYDPALIDEADWQGMTSWLRKICDSEIPGDFSATKTMDEWFKKLAEAEIHVVSSSGTSGNYSFVPRDPLTREAAIINSGRVFEPVFSKLGEDPMGYDAALLGFRSAATGVQIGSNAIANVVKDAYFLFDMDMPADAVRILQRGPSSEEERERIEEFQRLLVTEKDARYNEVLERMRASVEKGQKVLVNGACYQVKELCTMAAEQGGIILPEGSLLLFGGGWKSFEDERIDRDELLKLIDTCFGLRGDDTVEGYSMTEITTAMTCCEHGRFHIPPLLEPMVFDEGLMPLPGGNREGIFGFLDPFALSYPGFLITGDFIDLRHGECRCGKKGHAINGEIRRAPGKEVKGCGGIMASVRA